MNFITMQQELSDRLSAFDETISSDATRLKRWLNLAQQDIAAEWDWPFLVKLDIIQTVADFSTGTVAINANSTALTFSAAPTVSMADRFIQFSNTDDWYQITSHTASSTSATIDPAYSGTSNLTASSYTIRKIYYSIDSTIDTIFDVKISKVSSRDLISLSPGPYDKILNFRDETGTPLYYFLTDPSSGSPRISFYPIPDEIINVYIRGKTRFSDMSADSDTSIIPQAYHSAILDRASQYGFSKLNDMSRAKFYHDRSELTVLKMKQVYEQDKGTRRITRSVDPSDYLGYGNVPLQGQSIVGNLIYDLGNWS